jgi:predicted nuclease of predicted toxin-antitoxin system
LRLLLDENLSPRLARALSVAFPESAHVSEVGLSAANDLAIWNYARLNHFMIVTKDDDFESLALVRGAPPKVIIVRAGNTSSADILALLSASAARITTFAGHASEALLVI